MKTQEIAERTQKITLDNGLRLIVAEVPYTRAASLAFFVGTGSRYEDDHIAGASHLIEHMLFKGSEKRPTAGQISLAIESVGGMLNASTGKETTVYFSKVPYEHYDLALDVLSDMLRHPVFDATEFSKERRVVVEEIRMLVDDPQSWSTMLLMEEVFPRHPLGRDIAGSVDSVLGMNRDDLLGYIQSHYGAENVVLSVAGRLDGRQTVEQLVESLSDWPVGAKPEYEPLKGRQRKPRVKVGRRKTEQAYLEIATRAIRRSDPDRYVLVLLDAIMGEGMSSRLFQEVREKRGLAYSVHSYIGAFHDAGMWAVSAGVDPKRLDEAYSAILSELARIRNEAVTDEELQKAREQVKGHLVLGLEDSFSIASWWGRQEVLGDKLKTVDDVLAAIQAVTVADVQRLAREILQVESTTVALVGPFNQALGKSLRAGLEQAEI
jgi:predicted Zn-dependent peptidase